MSPPPSRGFDNTSRLTKRIFMHATSNKPGIYLHVASKIIASAILLFRNATTENQSVNRRYAHFITRTKNNQLSVDGA